MKLIKIKDDHYVVVDETIQSVNGYYYDDFIKAIRNTNGAEYGEASHCWQITHSTQPLESIVTEDSFKSYDFIPLQEVKELIGEVDVEEKADERYFEQAQRINDSDIRGYIVSATKGGFVDGYNQALEDNKEKKYTEFDLHNLLRARRQLYSHTDANVVRDFIQSLQPKTSWEVEIVDGKLKLK